MRRPNLARLQAGTVAEGRELRLGHVDGQPVVGVEGELDFSVVGRLREVVLGAVSPAARGLVLDLTGATYLDSAGIHLLVRLTDQLAAHRQQLRLVVPRASPLERLLEIAGLVGGVLAVDGDVGTAVDALGART